MERGREFAPNTREDFIETIGDIACGGCELRVCSTDRHHLIFGEDLSDAERLLKSHPDFIIKGICRAKHEGVHRTWDRSEPLSDNFAIGFLSSSPIDLGANQRRKLKDLRKGRR